jgi:hypothetical protein
LFRISYKNDNANGIKSTHWRDEQVQRREIATGNGDGVDLIGYAKGVSDGFGQQLFESGGLAL